MSAIWPISDLRFGVANTEIGVIQALEPGRCIFAHICTSREILVERCASGYQYDKLAAALD
jgi:hypothetical protein